MTYTLLEPTLNELRDYYRNYPVRDDLSPVTAMRYDELLDELEPYRMHHRILDVGCGAGMFLEKARLRNWEVHGTEFGDRALQACAARGIRVIEGSLDPKNYAAASFDVICSFEVIEHVTHPARELHLMHSLLRPGGLLYLTTPNFNCIDRRISRGNWSVVNYPEHLNYFTPATLHTLLTKQDFHRKWLHTTGISISRLKAGRTKDPNKKADARRSEEKLREGMESKMHLKLAKWLINSALNAFRLGDSMKAGYIKNAPAPINDDMAPLP